MRQYSTRARRITAERRLRRGTRALLATVTLAALGTAGALAAAPVTAAPAVTGSLSAPHITLVSGDHALTAAWHAVPGATGYTVRVGRTPSLAHARVIRTAKRSVRIPRLVNGRQVYVGVTPAGAGVVPAVVGGSGVVIGAPASGVPFPVTGVTASPGDAANQVRVDWTGGGRASKVAVIAGSDVITNQRSFNSGWYPATTRSITITVPPEYLPYLGGGTGNPVWVKVVESNGPSTDFGPSYSYERKYRPSPVGTWSFARAVVPAADVTRLRVAELNTQSVGATTRFSSDNRWSARAPRLATYIAKAHTDVLMTAELATNVLGQCLNHPHLGQPYSCRSHTQVADLAKRLSPLRLADTDAYDRVLDRMRDAPRWNAKVTNGAHVFYDPAHLTLLDHGFFAPAMTPAESFANVTGLGVSNWTGAEPIGPDRWLTWAEFRTAEGRQFYAVAGHFPVGDAASVVAARAEEGQKLAAAIDVLAGSTPVVLGADMNSDAVRSPRAPQVTFMQRGWFDASAVAEKRLRTGMRVSTANGSGAQDGTDPGYGSKPIVHPYETSRIDYILLRNSPYTFRYENVLHLHANGTFVKLLQGTDHNMQLADIGIAGPTS